MMINQTTDGGDEVDAATPAFPRFTLSDYLTLLEDQRTLLIELMTPCPGGDGVTGCMHTEPHAYHSDDTAGDLEAALTIYHDLFSSEIFWLNAGDEADRLMTEWMKRQWDEALESTGYLPEDDESLHDLIPMYSCDGISGTFYDYFARIAKALDPTGAPTP